jgi:hypothetical protein
VKRIAVAGGAMVLAAGLALVGAVALGWHRGTSRAVEFGALATPVTTDPTATDDPVVAAVLVGTVYPTVASLGTVTPEDSGYTVRLRTGVPVSADQVTQALTHSHDSGSPGVKGALAAVDTVSTVDRRTVRIALSHPDANLPKALAGRAGAVVVPDAGQYRIAMFAPGRSLTLARRNGSGPSIVDWRFYGDVESLRADLAAGKLDIVAPAVDAKLPEGARRIDGPTGPPITVAVSPARRGDQKLMEAVKSAATVPAAVAVPDGSSGPPPLIVRATNEPDVVAAAQAVRRRLAASGIAATVFSSPPDQWRQLVDAGSYDLAVGTGLPGDTVGIVHYAMIVTNRITGQPVMGDGGSIDLSTVHLR